MVEGEHCIVERAGARDRSAGAEDEVEEQRIMEGAGAKEYSAGAEWQKEDEVEAEQRMQKQHRLLLVAKMGWESEERVIVL
jgi:hypothetical protein